jgi:hypothetical protein
MKTRSIRPNRNKPHYVVSQSLKNATSSINKIVPSNLKLTPSNPKFA